MASARASLPAVLIASQTPLRFAFEDPGQCSVSSPWTPRLTARSALLRRLASGLSLPGAGPSPQPPAGVGTPGRPKSSAAGSSLP
jgi:hypothetical protein